MRKCYPGGKTKAFNITYDDGVLQDVPFVAMLNRYGLKGTFNLNAQLMEEEFVWTLPMACRYAGWILPLRSRYMMAMRWPVIP